MSENNVSADVLIEADGAAVTVIDVREKDDVLVHPFGITVNIPFSQLSKHIDEIPKDKPVYVICSVGNLSEEVVEILADRGYDAYSVEGDFKAYEQALKSKPVRVDAKGLKCPGPIVKVADEMRPIAIGQHIIRICGKHIILFIICTIYNIRLSKTQKKSPDPKIERKSCKQFVRHISYFLWLTFDLHLLRCLLLLHKLQTNNCALLTNQHCLILDYLSNEQISQTAWLRDLLTPLLDLNFKISFEQFCLICRNPAYNKTLRDISLSNHKSFWAAFCKNKNQSAGLICRQFNKSTEENYYEIIT